MSPSGSAPSCSIEQRPERLARPAHELGQVRAGVDQPVDQRKDARRPPVRDEAEHFGVELVAHQAEHLADPLRR